jgi:hypothetical protein
MAGVAMGPQRGLRPSEDSPCEAGDEDKHVMSALRGLVDTVGGLWELMLLGLRHGTKMKGPYWRWRAETAFGSNPARRPPLSQRLRAVLAYGRWVYRMKRGR